MKSSPSNFVNDFFSWVHLGKFLAFHIILHEWFYFSIVCFSFMFIRSTFSLLTTYHLLLPHSQLNVLSLLNRLMVSPPSPKSIFYYYSFISCLQALYSNLFRSYFSKQSLNHRFWYLVLMSSRSFGDLWQWDDWFLSEVYNILSSASFLFNSLARLLSHP